MSGRYERRSVSLTINLSCHPLKKPQPRLKTAMQSIEDIDLAEMVVKAQRNVSDSYLHYKKGLHGVAREFVEIKLQVRIFQYDVCVEMINAIRNQPTGFSVSVALKGLVLRLFEFDQILRGALIPRIQAFAKARDIELDQDSIKQLRRKWKVELHHLQGWHHVRNQAAGHYGLDFQKQVEALESLSFSDLMGVATGFLHFAQGLFKILRDTGKGETSDERPLN